MAVKDWSTTASTNATADAANGINFAEGQSPGSLNDSMRSMMAVIKGDLANSLSASGYQKLPNGLIIQWGSANQALSDYQITFPTAFPTAVFAVTTTVHANIGANTVIVAQADAATAATFAVRIRSITSGSVVSVNSQTVSWIAIGY